MATSATGWAKCEPRADALGDRVHDQRVGVAHDHYTESVVEVHVFVTVDVPHAAPAPVFDEDGLRRGVLE